MTDISSIVPNERTIEIKHPATGEPIGLSINLLPASAPPVLAAQRKMINDRLQRNSKTTAESMEQNRLALIESAVNGWSWRGDLTFEGKKPEFTPENLRKVLKKLTWLRDQIDQELGNDAAFFESLANA